MCLLSDAEMEKLAQKKKEKKQVLESVGETNSITHTHTQFFFYLLPN